MDSNNPYICEHTSEYYILEYKELNSSDDDSSGDNKDKITLYDYLLEIVFGRWYLLAQIYSVLQALLTFPIQYNYILLLWIYLVGWDSLDMLASVPITTSTSRASRSWPAILTLQLPSLLGCPIFHYALT